MVSARLTRSLNSCATVNACRPVRVSTHSRSKSGAASACALRATADSNLLNLARNLGLVTGAAAMGAVFAHAAGASDITAAPPAAVAAGLQVTFMAAAALIVVALAIGIASRVLRA